MDDERSDQFLSSARTLLGERCGEVRFDPDGGLRVTVIDLRTADSAALAALGEQMGVADRVRIEQADPSALRLWAQLSRDLLELQDRRPSVLSEWPSPSVAYKRPPVDIELAAFAEDVAADLHARYGDFVRLQLGAMSYPDPSAKPSSAWGLGERRLMSSDEFGAALDGPLSVVSGHSTDHRLLLTNRGDSPVAVVTNGQVTALVVDPVDGRTVGGFSGGQAMPRQDFRISPGQTVRIPLLVGTACIDPDLGYRVPAGQWAVVAPLQLTDGRALRTPPLPITITNGPGDPPTDHPWTVD